jgi:hypothetical protein
MRSRIGRHRLSRGRAGSGVGLSGAGLSGFGIVIEAVRRRVSVATVTSFLPSAAKDRACPTGLWYDGTVTADILLAEAYAPLLLLAERVDEAQGWTPTGLPGWTVRDLLLHLASDCQRALVALATPVDGPADTDEVTYWSEWQPGTDAARAGLRGTRIMATAWTSVRGPADLYTETARAVLHVAESADPVAVVATQGRRLTVHALLHTLAVEAAVHHLDLEPVLPDPPSPLVLREVRRVLDGLLGEPAPADWDDIRYARTGTGRLPLDPHERAALGPRADRFPLFG